MMTMLKKLKFRLFALTKALGRITQRHPFKGALAQLVERFAGSEEVRGSTPLGSTKNLFQ